MELPSQHEHLDQCTSFLDLPAEIRSQIYNFYFIDTVSYLRTEWVVTNETEHSLRRSQIDPRVRRQTKSLQARPWTKLQPWPDDRINHRPHVWASQTNTALLRSCKQVYSEALPFYLSARIFSHIEDGDEFFPSFLEILPASFMQSIKHLRINHIYFTRYIDPSIYPRNEPFYLNDGGETKRLRHLLNTLVFPNLESFTLDTEVWRHSLSHRYPATAGEIYYKIIANKFNMGRARTDALNVFVAMNMLSARYPSIQTVLWNFHLFWSVEFMAYGTIQKMERFGWTTYVYDGKHDTITSDPNKSWTAEREVKVEVEAEDED